MAKQTKTQDNVTVLKGAIPMSGAGGRKYKIRNPTNHDFTSDPVLEGKIVQKAMMKVDGQDRVFLVIDNGSDLSQVYESKALEDVFKLGDVGDFCRLEYKGEKDLGGGRTFKRFSVAVWSE